MSAQRLNPNNFFPRVAMLYCPPRHDRYALFYDQARLLRTNSVNKDIHWIETGSHLSSHLTRVYIAFANLSAFARIANCICILHALQTVSAFCLTINCAPLHISCSNLLTRSSQHCILAYSITPSRTCTLQSQLSKIRGSRKNPNVPMSDLHVGCTSTGHLIATILTKCMR